MYRTIDINHGARRLTVAEGQSVFEALKGEGIFLPSVCGGRGLCGRCRLRVFNGDWPITPAEQRKCTADELTEGIRLGCQLPVNADVSIEIPEELFATKQFRGTIEAISNLTHDIKHLRIRLSEPERIEFTPGQHIELAVPVYAGSPKPVSRAYSLASTPGCDRGIELMIRFVPGGIASTWVFTVLKVGDELSFNGPYGSFGLSRSDREMIWVAGGSGMSPFWSMIRHMKQIGLGRECTYFFGAVQRRDLFLLDEFRRLEDELDWFSFVPALSAPAAEDNWSGQTGLITEVLERRTIGENCEAYLCGSPGMIGAAVKVLRSHGITEDRTFYDEFE
ncbi:MAG: 2Fe-2S iron-sulfur cluster binding domain-containing protein [Planctomycetes bacterium]|nr:2Fe-2S iron-sulfur cluster binding domain-containing protein [Planctomycetota bacterium]